MEKYMRVELGTGYCGETEVLYYPLKDGHDEIADEDREIYTEMAVEHCESFGRDYEEYCDEMELDPDEGIGYDEYVLGCVEAGYIEIVEIEYEDEIDDGEIMEGCYAFD